MTYEEALHKTAAYCSQTEHSKAEVRDKMQKWDVSADVQDAIIGYLEQENYLNQQRYALAYARDKFRYNKWGKVRIRLELQRKGISAEEIQEALDMLETEAYLEQAIELAIAKLKHLKYSDEYERDGKLYRFLTGRGFESGVIREALKRAVGSTPADE